MDALRQKSLRQTDYLRFLLDEFFAGRVATVTPMNARGCQLSLLVTDDALDARKIFRSLEAAGVVADWREPNVIRVAPVPLYNSFEDLFELSLRLAEAIELNDQK